MTQSDKGLAKIAEDASPRRHAEISQVKVKDTPLVNNKLPPAEILCGEWIMSTQPFVHPTVSLLYSVRLVVDVMSLIITGDVTQFHTPFVYLSNIFST